MARGLSVSGMGGRNPVTGRFSGGSGVHWYIDTLTPNLRKLVPALPESIKFLLSEEAIELEQQMQNEAPWTDQTGAARAGLRATPFGEGLKQGLYLYHTVSYGIWLEVRWDGAYAIIIPTLENNNIMERLQDALEYAVEVL